MRKEKREKKDRLERPVSGLLLRRSAILLWVAAALFSALLIRIFLLQTRDYQKYSEKVKEQITTESKINAKRGLITDANGVVLATGITTYRVFISPSSIAYEQRERTKSGEDIDLKETLATELSSILNLSHDFVYQECGKRGYLDRTLKKGVDENTVSSVREVIAKYSLEQSVYVEANEKRYYPLGSLASHVLGFTGSDGTGLYGLEYSYNSYLAGTGGSYVTARDARGNEMPNEYSAYIKAEDGYHIHTTLDVAVQSALEDALEAAYIEAQGKNRAAGIVMNVNTGEILGMAVYPSFDLNDPWNLDAVSKQKLKASGYAEGSEEYSALRRELLLSMWSNKAVTESYIPGSTFKIITASMALQEKIVKLEETFQCSGFRTVAGYQIHCHKRKGHGTLTFVQGIQQSCNPVLMEMGLRIGKGKFYNYLASFGYLEKTGIDLPGEGNGLFISEDRFSELDLAIYSFGQNFNVTMIQQITAVAAVANGGYLVTPHLVSSITDSDGKLIKSFETQVKRQVVSADVCKTVSEILQGGVEGEGGAKNAYVAGYRIAAKTGTSQKKNAESLGKYVCSTVAYAPAEDAKYAVLIMVDEPSYGILYGSTVAAPYVGEVMEKILPYLGVEAKYSEAELEKRAVEIPDCVGLSVKAAKDACKSMTVEVIGDPNAQVLRQVPTAGTKVAGDSARILLYTEPNPSSEDFIQVPNAVGKTAEEANEMLINAGLNLSIRGTNPPNLGGVSVIEQSLPPGTLVERGTVIEILFRVLDDEDESTFEELEELTGTGGTHETD